MDSLSAGSQALQAVRVLASRWKAEASILEGRFRAIADRSHVVDGELKGVDTVVQTEMGDYRVRYAGLRKGWTSDCSCGLNDGCVHLLAALCSALNLDLRPLLDDSLSDPSTDPRKLAGAKADAASSPKGLRLKEVVETKLGRTLAREEFAFVNRVEALFSRFAGSSSIPSESLEAFLGSRRSAGQESHEVWPSRPQGAWEGWLYLAIFLKIRGAPIPGFMSGITTSLELAGLEKGWVQYVELRCWEDHLDRLLADLDSLRARVSIEVRLVLGLQSASLEWMRMGQSEWESVREPQLEELSRVFMESRMDGSSASRVLLEDFLGACMGTPEIGYSRAENRERLGRILMDPLLRNRVVTVEGEGYEWPEEVLRWTLEPSEAEGEGYRLCLARGDGGGVSAPLFVVGGNLNLYVTAGAVYRTAPLLRLDPRQPLRIPPAGLNSPKSVRLLQGLGVELPAELAERVVVVEPKVRVHCWLESKGNEERLKVRVHSDFGEFGEQILTESGWQGRLRSDREQDRIISVEDRSLRALPGLLQALGLKDDAEDEEGWERSVGKRFAEEFAPWIEGIPEGVELQLEGDLRSFRQEVVKGTFQLEVRESAPDWFDLRVALSVSETELTAEEIQLLLEGRGKYVRLKGKGWRRLEFDMDDEAAGQFAELGLSLSDLDGPPQRFHAVQLASSTASRLIEKETRERISRRAREIQTQVQPEIPEGVQAQLRPYQNAGFHFLAYLSVNRFGGILADDMGLGKTLQTLTWVMWLRSLPDFGQGKTLVVCPKSVVQNWLLEAERFTPELRAATWQGGDSAGLRRVLAQNDLVVVNYAQLRLSAPALTAQRWHAIVLDEAQYIKNPASQTALSACALQGPYRLALSGTPIENRLLDLWSIMQFAMPGLLGSRAHFQRLYDSKTDPLARRKLSGRVRPFILRRNKSEVAKDLPPRIEEDLVVEMEGTQALLYRAELKNARQSLLRIRTGKELDKQRFNVLTSLLRLRQICCHPGLVSEEHGHVDSAKMEALTDLLEPLMEEGHKVLVFSQFVEMLDRVEREMEARGWSTYVLTGETEDRGDLVAEFQRHEGSAVFLISLRAGGMGLNLTSASYVVLFDPWWNPAVENQAIDRTHRIGQTQQVIAYRLVAKDSIEQKIRHLQRSKSAMAGDILGEEAFGRALTLEDFQFLMGE